MVYDVDFKFVKKYYKSILPKFSIHILLDSGMQLDL